MSQKEEVFYKETYPKIRDWFQHSAPRLQLLKLCNDYIPVLTGVMYAGLVFASAWFWHREVFFRILLIPAITLALVTVLRKCIKAERPYFKYKFEPLIYKDAKKDSMPSRHCASAAVIAMAALYMVPACGVLMLILSLFVCATRFLGGVHTAKQCAAGWIIGILFGIAGFFVL